MYVRINPSVFGRGFMSFSGSLLGGGGGGAVSDVSLVEITDIRHWLLAGRMFHTGDKSGHISSPKYKK